jgi:hypothetical protein
MTTWSVLATPIRLTAMNEEAVFAIFVSPADFGLTQVEQAPCATPLCGESSELGVDMGVEASSPKLDAVALSLRRRCVGRRCVGRRYVRLE